MCVCVCVCLGIWMGVKCLWSPEENSISLAAAVKQAVISFPMWALVIELRSSVGVVSSLNCWAISLASESLHFQAVETNMNILWHVKRTWNKNFSIYKQRFPENTMPSCIHMTWIPQKQCLAIQQRPYGSQGLKHLLFGFWRNTFFGHLIAIIPGFKMKVHSLDVC